LGLFVFEKPDFRRRVMKMKSGNSFQIVETGSKRLSTRKILLIASICLLLTPAVFAASGTVYYNDTLQQIEGLECTKS
jgi:hypothetical protein